MSNVDFVEININNIGNNLDLLIDIKNNTVTVNNKLKQIHKEKIYELFRIIRTWKNNYSISNNIDGEKFTIKIVSERYEDKLIGNGSYPENYYEFKQWIGDLYE